MKVRRQRAASMLVIWSVLALMLVGMGRLVAELWKLQVKGQSGFEEVFRHQSVRRVRLPSVRGKIYDTTGTCLADSIPNYSIAIYTAELRAPRSAVANTLELVHEIWARIGRKPDVTYDEIRRHMVLTPNQPLVAWQHLSRDETATWRAAFENWTAPPRGSFLRRRIPGLNLGKPVEGDTIVIHTDELLRQQTSTAANTLELVYTIAERIGKSELPVTLQDIRNHIYARRPLPLLVWQQIDEETLAKWTDTCSNLTGTDIYCEPARTYPEGENLAHLIGYTREAEAIREEEGQRYDFDMRGLEGIKGLESTYNALLSGEPGHKLVEIDVSGFHHRDLQYRPPEPGGDLVLTIDHNIQRFAAEALAMKQNGEDDLPVRGAVVVIDPNNGDVLAIASSPTFDPNEYMASSTYRSALNKDPLRRAFNRAVYGQYAPGSTFKPIAALGVLRDHPEYARIEHTCRGSLAVNNRRMRCWDRNGHGKITLRQALMHSCNVYMFEMAQDVGFDPIQAMAGEMGLGQYAGLFPELDKPPEQKDAQYGNLPDRAINAIDLCNMSIGQGAITASPLQMAMAAAAIANGGTLYRPRLVRKWRTGPDEDYNTNPGWAIRHIDAPVDAFELVRGGMHDVVEDPDGTARQARVPGVVMAGKTGSAQYRKRVDGEVVSSVYAWMISFAPYDFPRYAVAMMVEDGVSGGTTIGPRLSALYQKMFAYDGTLKTEVMQ